MSSSHPTGGKPDSAPGYKRPIPGMAGGVGVGMWQYWFFVARKALLLVTQLKSSFP